MGEGSSYDALPFPSPSFCDPDVKMNDVERFTPFAIPMLRPSIPHWIITRVQAALAIKTKSDFE